MVTENVQIISDQECNRGYSLIFLFKVLMEFEKGEMSMITREGFEMYTHIIRLINICDLYLMG